MLVISDAGLYCPQGDFYIDPWRPVDRAVITHAHSDHARWGSRRYLCATAGKRILQTRLGPSAVIDTLDYGQSQTLNGVHVSLHPAGHILGSAQVRVELHGQVWVVSGDYKTSTDTGSHDSTCAPFEPVRCDVFVTESTFGLPVYRWPPQSEVFAEINTWWRANQAAGRTSVLLAYALGKAQRLISGLDPSIGPIYCHGATDKLTTDYRACGVALPPTQPVSAVPAGRSKAQPKSRNWHHAMIVAPPSAIGTPWMRRFGETSVAFASGWMRVRGARRRRAVDRGFVLSDHADWPGLLAAIEATRASRVLVTHGFTSVLVRYLGQRGLQAEVVATRFEGERDDALDEANDSTSPTPASAATPDP